MMDTMAPSTPGKFKPEKPHHHHHHRLLLRLQHSPLLKSAFISFFALALFLTLFLLSPSPHSSHSSSHIERRSLRTSSSSWGGSSCEKRVHNSARIRRKSGGMSVLITGAIGFVGTHVSAALKRRGDGVLGLDSFNHYYEPSLKRARRALLERYGKGGLEEEHEEGRGGWAGEEEEEEEDWELRWTAEIGN